MQLNKALKGSILFLIIMAIVACSGLHKKKNNDQSSMKVDRMYDADSNMNDNVSSDEQARLEIQENNTVYFSLDKYDIQPEYAQILDQHASLLRSNPSYKIIIEGHADERGTPEYNIALGERRANAVKMYLQGRGVSADNMYIISYGKEKPIILGHDEAAYAKNRCAVIILH